MKPKIELGREYKTRGGSKAVVYRDDGRGSYPLLGAVEHADEWEMICWSRAGKYIEDHVHVHDLILPRTVMVPVDVPEWARFVVAANDRSVHRITFSTDLIPHAIRIEDWIAELEGDHRA